ncbi:MAG: SIMPL domain-containing protein [Acidimicrobiia bacterium]|nr:SIMPL domain-containing protein [Acidimicrobiia bacterium]
MSPAATPRWKVALVAAAAAGAATLAIVATAALGGDAGATVPPSTEPGATEPADETSARTIAVTGHGTVEVTPDVADLWLGVQATRPTATEAMDVIAAKSTDLVATLKALGAEARDIQTSGVSLYPNYGNDGVAINGYQASVSVNVRLRDIDGVGAVLDGVQGFVGEELTIGGISFSYDDPEAVLGDARAAAVDNARERAAQYAAAAGTDVGDVIRIAESSAETFPPVYYAEGRVAADEAGAVAIEPGTQELSADVTVVFEMT